MMPLWLELVLLWAGGAVIGWSIVYCLYQIWRPR